MKIKTNKVKKEHYLIRQDNTIYNFFKTNFSQAAVSIKMSNVLICFCSFDLSCPIVKKVNFMKNLILYCLVLLKLIAFFF